MLSFDAARAHWALAMLFGGLFLSMGLYIGFYGARKREVHQGEGAPDVQHTGDTVPPFLAIFYVMTAAALVGYLVWMVTSGTSY